MPGTVIVKPIEANFENDLKVELAVNVNPYCVVTVGDSKVRGMTSKSSKFPFWKGTFHVPRKEEHYCYIEIKDHKVSPHEVIGVSKIDLDEVDENGVTTKWYDVYYKKKPCGQMLVEVIMENSDNPEQFLEFNETEGREISPIKPAPPSLTKQDSGFDIPVRNFLEKPHMKDRGHPHFVKSGFANQISNDSEEGDKNGLSGTDFSLTGNNDSATFKEGPADENISKVDLGDSLPLIRVDDDLADTNLVVTKEAGNLNASAFV